MTFWFFLQPHISPQDNGACPAGLFSHPRMLCSPCSTATYKCLFRAQIAETHGQCPLPFYLSRRPQLLMPSGSADCFIPQFPLCRHYGLSQAGHRLTTPTPCLQTARASWQYPCSMIWPEYGSAMQDRNSSRISSVLFLRVSIEVNIEENHPHCQGQYLQCKGYRPRIARKTIAACNHIGIFHFVSWILSR